MLPAGPERGRDRGCAGRPDRAQIEAVRVDREDAAPTADLLGVDHLAGEAAWTSREGAEELIDQAVRRGAHLGRCRGHQRAERRLALGERGRARRDARLLSGGLRGVGVTYASPTSSVLAELFAAGCAKMRITYSAP